MQGLSIKDTIEIVQDKYYIQDRLERLFFTPPSDIPGFFDDGSQIMDLFWEPAVPETARALLFEVKRLVTKYEPTINLISILAGLFPTDNDEVILMIELMFTMKGEVEIQKIRLSKLREK